MIEKNIIFSGLPNSGKTTFIAALWYSIFNRTDEGGYVCDSLENTENSYLHAITESWMLCNDVIRTAQHRPENVIIKIKNDSKNDRIILNIPDISGETFNSQFAQREWDENFDSIIKEAQGLLLFVDPRDKQNMPRLIFAESEYYRIFDDGGINEKPKAPWTEKLAPSQVKLVDFLQMLEMHNQGVINKISVIISCWDLVPSGNNPEAWCQKQLPLLFQYLKSNEHLKVKYFGVSSQGGAYDDENLKTALLTKEPVDRIVVTDGIESSNDILKPILWITNEN